MATKNNAKNTAAANKGTEAQAGYTDLEHLEPGNEAAAANKETAWNRVPAVVNGLKIEDGKVVAGTLVKQCTVSYNKASEPHNLTAEFDLSGLDVASIIARQVTKSGVIDLQRGLRQAPTEEDLVALISQGPVQVALADAGRSPWADPDAKRGPRDPKKTVANMSKERRAALLQALLAADEDDDDGE